MASERRPLAETSELANSVRDDLPSTYVLVVTEAAWADLGIQERPPPQTLWDELPPLVQKFLDRYKTPDAIDDGVPLRSRRGEGVYRIRRDHPSGDRRGATWADKDDGVVWLLRAVSLADYPNEERAYEVFENMAVGDLFPGAEERERAAAAQRLAHTMRALRGAMQEASELPEEWHEARCRGAGQADGEGEIVGRAYVEQIEEEDGTMTDRFMITFRKPPVSGLSAEKWVALIESRIFPQGAEVYPVTGKGLPPGSPLDQSAEMALAQAD